MILYWFSWFFTKSLFEGIRLEYISCFELWSVVINVI